MGESMQDTTEKLRLRNELRAARDAVSAGVRAEWSASIRERITLFVAENFEASKGTLRVFAYAAFGSEAEVLPLHMTSDTRRGTRSSVSVALPVIELDQAACKRREMRFRSYAAGEDLAPNRFGILEPTSGEFVTPKSGDLVLVPALAVSKSGHRLGYGGGYYDRFLAGHAGVVTVGVAFALSYGAEFPIEEHDFPLDVLITEREIIRFSSAKRR